jgi:hypothetical protein
MKQQFVELVTPFPSLALIVVLAFGLSSCGVLVGGAGTAAYCHTYGC